MSTGTKIQWTDATWSPTTGCDQVSPGCDNCYALTMAKRLKAMGQPRYQRDGDPRTSGPGFGLTVHHDVLDKPLRWRKPRRVFVNSMSDLFHPQVSDEFIAEVFAVMALTRRHTYQVLTKRPARMRSLLSQPGFFRSVASESYPLRDHVGAEIGGGASPWPLPNVWLGVSVEDQTRADQRIPLLLDTPAAIRFLSCEPLLGPVDLSEHIGCYHDDDVAGGSYVYGPHADPYHRYDGPDLGWVIVGGESGPGARPMHPDWARSLVEQCRAAGVAPFVKQLGAWSTRLDATAKVRQMVGELLMFRHGGHGGDPDEWPEELRVREFPRPVVTA
jgi:protein gp37